MDGVSEHGGQGLRGREVIAETSNRVGTAAASIAPHTEKVHEEVTSELDTEHLGDHVEIGHESRLENDGDVGGVEQLDGVAAVLSSVPGALDG